MRYEVDYAQHPAFSPYISGSNYDLRLETIFDDVDSRVRKQVRSGQDDADFVSRERQAFTQQLSRSETPDEKLRPYVVSSYARALLRTLDEEKRRLRWGHGLKSARPTARRDAEKIQSQGYALYNMPAQQLSRLRELLDKDIDEARRNGAMSPDVIATKAPSDPEARDIVHNFCEEAGIFDALSAYYGGNYRSVGFVVHVSQPSDTWFHVFDDIGLKMPKTTQMHFDLDFEAPKSMLYLNDVGLSQGPFSLRAKSGDFEWFGTELAFRKEIGIGVHSYIKENCGKSTEGNTSIFRHVEARQAYASLPKPLRGSSHQADHILDKTILSDQLLSSEIRLCGEAGTMPVFTGSHVLHRGGLVTDGERIALQIVYYKVGEQTKEPRSLYRRMRATLGGLARAAGVRK